MRGRRVVAAAALMAGTLVACGGESGEAERSPRTTWQHTVPSVDSSPNEAETNRQLRDALVSVGYKRTPEGVWIGILEGADSRVAGLQHSIGVKVMALLAEAGPISTTVNGVTKDVALSKPGPDTVVAMSYVARNQDVSSAPIVGNAPGSVTQQFLTSDLKMTAAIGAISQEPETMIRDAGVEYCQAMDMSVVGGEFDPADPARDYNTRKEAACNAAGILGDTAFIGAGYSVFISRVEGRRLQEPAAHGANIPYPVLSQHLYERAAATLR